MTTQQQSSVQRNVYNVIASRFIEQLDTEIIPWHVSFKDSGLPINLISGQPYTGINVWLLSSLNYAHNVFLTGKQVKDLNATIKKDQQANIAVFMGKDQTLKYYGLYNIEQVDNLPQASIPIKNIVDNPIQQCEELVRRFHNIPCIIYDGSECCYNPQTDCINMAQRKLFDEDYEQYACFFQALIWATGHPSRLNNKDLQKISPYLTEWEYCIEVLIVEMGSSYLCSLAGIEPRHIRYFEPEDAHGWRRFLLGDPTAIIAASIQAQKAVNYLLNTSAKK